MDDIVKVIVDPFSLATVRLDLIYEESVISTGTGFLWRQDNRWSLVTCWHCLTGVHPETGQPISRTGARPDSVRIHFVRSDMSEKRSLISKLYLESGEANWLVHGVHRHEVDVAIHPLSLDLTDDVINEAINEIPQNPLALKVGSDLFIIGYPLNINRMGLPIWKRATVAIEPDSVQDSNGDRTLLVDTATREGMSGAPVIQRTTGPHRKTETTMSMSGGVGNKLVGLYAGRLSTKDPFGAQIGVVWPIRYIEEIATSGVRDTFTITG